MSGKTSDILGELLPYYKGTTKLEREKQYRSNPSLSQSFLKNIIKGESEKSTSEAMKFGSVVDALLTMNEHFSEMFVLDDTEGMTEKVQFWFDQTVSTKGTKCSWSQFEKAMLGVARKEKYFANWSDEALMKKTGSAKKSFELSKGLKLGMQILDKDTYVKANSLVDTVLESHMLDRTLSRFNDRVVHQLPLYFTFNGVNCKALLDTCMIDFESKVVCPGDYKSTGAQSLSQWMRFAESLRYDIQASFYTHALEQIFPDFIILPFEFYVLRPGGNLPVTVPVPASYNTYGRYGYKKYGKQFRGWQWAIEKFLQYGDQATDSDLIESNYRVPLDFGIWE